MREFTTIPATDGIRRLPRLGKIALGVRDKTKAGAEYPREVEYFVLAEEGIVSDALRDKFAAVYGGKPAALDVVFPSEEIADFFPSAYKLYGAGAGLKCIGDGEEGRQVGALADREGEEAGQFFDIKCEGEDCEAFKAGQCKRVSSLTFMLPRVSVAGYWQIDTSSWHSRVDVLNDLAMARRVFGRIGGLISRKPPYKTALLLTREPREIQHAGKKRMHWPLRVRIRDAESLDLETLQKLRLAAPGGGLKVEQHDDPPLELVPANLHPAEQQARKENPQPPPSKDCGGAPEAGGGGGKESAAPPRCPECKGTDIVPSEATDDFDWACRNCGHLWFGPAVAGVENEEGTCTPT